MQEVDVTARFGPALGDWTILSKGSRGTIEALYQHPLSHNLEWSDVVALFEKLGTVDHKGHKEIAFGLGGEHRTIRKQHGKDLTTTEVMDFRHMLTRAGWAPQRPDAPVAAASADPAGEAPHSTDMLVVMDHHEAKLHHLDVRSADHVDHVIRPHDRHHLRHHVAHHDAAAEQRQRNPEDHAFYEEIAQAISSARSVVVIGHGTGRSNAAHHLIKFLHTHHAGTAPTIVRAVVANLSNLTAPQLLDLGRRALTAEPLPSLTRHPS